MGLFQQQNKVVKVVDMAEDIFSDKKHVLVFRTEQGDLLLGTNNIEDVSEQSWFQTFLNVQSVRDVQVVRPAPQQQEQRFAPPQQQQQAPPQQQMQMRMPLRPQPRPSFMDMTPETMTVDMWNEMNKEQQQQWLNKYNLA